MWIGKCIAWSFSSSFFPTEYLPSVCDFSFDLSSEAEDVYGHGRTCCKMAEVQRESSERASVEVGQDAKDITAASICKRSKRR